MTDYGNPKTIEDIPCIKMYGTDFRKEILNMHKAITELGLWNEMKDDPGENGYMFSDKPYVNKIVGHDLVRQCGTDTKKCFFIFLL